MQGKKRGQGSLVTDIWGALCLVCTFFSGNFGAKLVAELHGTHTWGPLIPLVATLLFGATFAVLLFKAEGSRDVQATRDVAGADWVFLGIYGGLSVFFSWTSGYLLWRYLDIAHQKGDWSLLLMVGVGACMAIYALVRFVQLVRKAGAFNWRAE